MSHVLDETSEVAVTDEARDAFLDIVEEAEGIAEEVGAAQDEDGLGQHLVLVVLHHGGHQEGQRLEGVGPGEGGQLDGRVLEGDQTEAQLPLDVHEVVAEFGGFLDAQFDLGQTELEGAKVIPGGGTYTDVETELGYLVSWVEASITCSCSQPAISSTSSWPASPWPRLANLHTLYSSSSSSFSGSFCQ